MKGNGIYPLHGKKDLKDFVKLRGKINRTSPYWISPLFRDQVKLIDKEKNPFYRHSDAEFFLIRKNNEVVGRIGAIINHNHNKEHNENLGFFGFFECINDQIIANELFQAAQDWLKARNVRSIRGPASPSVNDEYGLLVDGFDKPPVILMPYNPPYYSKLIETAGFTKVKDLYSYFLNEEGVFSGRVPAVAEKVRQRENITTRSLNMAKFENEINVIRDLYNRAWQSNWGAVPMTEEEFDALAKDLKPIVNPNLVIIAEYKGEPIGFSLALPDFNIALKNNRRGYLLPGIIRLLWHRKKIDMIRILVLGVVKEYQRTGASILLFYETAKRGLENGYKYGEAGWVLEDNVMMNRAAEFLKAQRYKTYRIYEKTL